ncbi:hypothetical protein B0H19DRAFT_1020117 [Mycena capillaripes]|nr:hypothetical protein B0H19DRAFT_1020117 [Mycena capillaripes]
MGGSAITPPNEWDENSTNSPNATGLQVLAHLTTMRKSLEARPLTSGVQQVKVEDLIVYYDADGQKSSIDRNATESDLGNLAAACNAVDDSLHEIYHRVGQIEPSKFAARTDLMAAGLLDFIAPALLGEDVGKSLRLERQRLHVYGPGSFVKPHKNTRQDEGIVGSLVAIFPTLHAGGAWTFENEDKTWKFDPISAASASNPSISYFAIGHTLAHSVAPIHTRYAVSITYDLVVVERSGTAVAAEHVLATSLQALLADPTFLPTDGFLASGLAHKYLIPQEPAWQANERGERINQPSVQWATVLSQLKGTDACLRFAAERVGLVPCA